MISELSITLHKMDKAAIAAMQLFSDAELNSQSIAYRKLCGLGYHAAAIILFRMSRSDYEVFLLNVCSDERLAYS